MKELELIAIRELINVYSTLKEMGLTEDITNKAKSIYNHLIPANTLLSNIVNSAVGRLFSVAYPNVDPDRMVPTKEEVEEIIKKLKKRKQELEE